jgi:collagenase-like PrtC family protease
MKQHSMSITLGPLLFNWNAAKRRDFYARIADEAAVATVCLGEIVCSKRLPFYQTDLPDIAERLRRAGKNVVFSSLALVTTPLERRLCADLAEMEDCDIEINDLSLLPYLKRGRSFRVGPLVNVYNEDTLRFLAGLGAHAVCATPELPLQDIEELAEVGISLDVACEVWAFGRMPLAISGRCHHARAAGLTKDSCQFVCGKDNDGLEVSSLDGKNMFAINGVQTLSHAYANAITDIDRIAKAGVSSLRLSPHDCDMVAVSGIFRDRIDGKICDLEAEDKIRVACNNVETANGYLSSEAGYKMIKPAKAAATESDGPH